MLCLCSLLSRKRRADRSPYGQEPGPRPYNPNNHHATTGMRGAGNYGRNSPLDEKKVHLPRTPTDFLAAREEHLSSTTSPETPDSPDAKWQSGGSSTSWSKAKDEGVDDDEKRAAESRAAAARRKAAQEEQDRLDFFQMM